MSFRNRCQISGAEGIINLSVPLQKGRDQKTLMKDVKIADGQPWQAQHWKTIVSCYNRSPWFEFYCDDLEGLYKTRFYFLVDWNRACFEWSLKVLHLPVKVSLTDHYQKVYSPEEGVDWRGKFLPKNRGAVPAQPGSATPGAPADLNGQPTYDSAAQPASATTGAPTDPAGAHRYRQVFEERTGFIPGLSILDLLFCEGKEAIRYIRS